MKRKEISLDIDIYTPTMLPMARLAQYLAAFAELLGNEESVHFSQVVKGSARCKAFVDEPAFPKVRERVEQVVDGSAPKPAMKGRSVGSPEPDSTTSPGATGRGTRQPPVRQ